MVISCDCGARLKISDDKLTAAGVRIKCPKCGVVHLAKKPPAPPAAPEPSMPWFAAASPDQEPSPGGALVLIAHDSSVVADMIASTLQRAGMATEYAPNGLEALRKATDLKPQAMVVDVGLTGIYGFELCERLKGNAETRNIKIVLLSSVYGLTAYKRSPVTLYGADDYIEKHHIPDQLADKLQRLLSGGKGELAPDARPAPQADETGPADEPGQPLAPLVSRKGITQRAQDAAITAPIGASRDAPAVPQAVHRGYQEPVLDIPEIPSILPSTPVTLNTGEKKRDPQPLTTKQEHLTGQEHRAGPPEADSSLFQDDGSVRLDAAFFEHEEYEASEGTTKQAKAHDPEEIEKAKRFARIIVSDIALYNQEAVEQGIRAGTFGELLKEDIAEGRALYDSRVPQAVRASKDYLQEAFDDFLAAKKKLR